MGKRKFMRRIDVCTELKKGDRVVVLDRSDCIGTCVPPTVRIGYIDSFSTDETMLYVNYNWRDSREGSMWMQVGQVYWSLTQPISNYIEVYKTNMSLKQCQARAVKLHPDWQWLRSE